MNARIKTLGNQIKALREEGKKFVLMLGAGASLSSGVMRTDKIVEQLLQDYGSHIPPGDPMDRFSKLWDSSPDLREIYLKSYLDKTPSQGYRQLAELIKDGYFDLIITFNFDRLLQRALTAEGLREGEDFLVIVRGDHNDAAIGQMLERQEPRVKILKLHGSVSGATFLFSDEEMLNYPEPIHNLVKNITRNHIIVCGYAFEDMCVVRAFSTEGGSIYCVNPSGKPKYLRGFITKRNSENYVIDGNDGKFDDFIGQLYDELREKNEPERPREDPFKYLGSLDVEDGEWLFGRESEVRELRQRMSPEKALFVIGPAKSGKTSLLRAGLLASLNSDTYHPVYLRCCGSIARTLSSQCKKGNLPAEAVSVESMLAAIASSTPKHVVLVLDQFERVVNKFPKSRQGKEQLVASLFSLLQCRHENLSVICVSADEGSHLLLALMQLKNLWEGPVNVDELPPEQVREIIVRTTLKAGFEFEPAILDRLQEEYAKALESDHSFSLAHVQAACSILCGKPRLDLNALIELMNNERPVLDLAINRCDVINFIEDVPSEARKLLRNVIRAVSHPECNERVVNYVRTYVTELRAEEPQVAVAA